MKKLIKVLAFFISGWAACLLFMVMTNTLFDGTNDGVYDTFHAWPFEIQVVHNEDGSPVKECCFFTYPLIGCMISRPQSSYYVCDPIDAFREPEVMEGENHKKADDGNGCPCPRWFPPCPAR